MSTTFENDITINQMQLAYLDRVVADLPSERHYADAAGHGHSPAWILGHLAIVGEMGGSLLGGPIKHPGWIPVFGPGSTGAVQPDADFAADAMLPALHEAYGRLQELATAADAERLAKPHGVDVLEGTPIKTVSHLTALLLTNHFAFHLSQLSSCRRSGGHPALF